MDAQAALLRSDADSALPSSETDWLIQQAKAIGFDLCGVVRAEKFPELERTQEWLARGYAGEMNYLKDPRRAEPRAAMAGLRTVIVCALNYNSDLPRSIDASSSQDQEPRAWISRYAWGSDYHEVLREKLEALAAALNERFGASFQARIYSDTGPINERVFAKHAGLGWIGKNTLLLNSKIGSWFFLGTILTTLNLSPTLGSADSPPADLCGSCTRCIDACPTDALVEPYLMDSRLCISYLTIEFRGSIPESLREPMGRHVFGCDICQDVCPWNRRAPITREEQFQPRRFPSSIEMQQPAGASDSLSQSSASQTDEYKEESLFSPRLEWLASLNQQQFSGLFHGSPIKRTKWRGLMRNACIALGNAGSKPKGALRERIFALLLQLSDSTEPVIAESARWALSRIEYL